MSVTTPGFSAFSSCKRCKRCERRGGKLFCLIHDCGALYEHPVLSMWDSWLCRKHREAVAPLLSYSDEDIEQARHVRGAQPIEMVDQTGAVYRYPSITKAWDATGISPSIIRKGLKTGQPVAGVIWRKYEPQ